MKPSFALIGPGRVGCAIGRQLHQAGYPLEAVIGRTRESAADGCYFIGASAAVATTAFEAAAAADIILLATRDDQLATVAAELCDNIRLAPEQTLIHFSGLLPAASLRTDSCPAAVLSIHPLLPFADRDMASSALAGCPCAIEGDNTGHQLALELVAAWGGLPFPIPSEKKALYHASACIASNFTISLAAVGCRLLEACGIDEKQAPQLLQPLLAATLENFTRLGPEQALTGPIVRGDATTVASHLDALDRIPETAELYRFLAKETLSLAKASGRLSAEKAAQVKPIIG